MLISRKTPAFYFTSVAHHRLPIFRTKGIKQVLCDAWAEARRRHNILILAYVIMPDHVHLLTYASREMEDVLRLMNGVAARRIVQYLQEGGFQSSLIKLRGELRGRNHRHSVWQHHSDSLDIYSEKIFRQKVDYIHTNPVRAGLINSADEYRYSSARLWAGNPIEDEPLMTDHAQINWR